MVIRVGWFLNAVASPTTEATPEVLSLLEERAGGFLRSGGSITWAEYQTMTVEEKNAFERAASQIRLEQAAAIAAIAAEWKPPVEVSEEDQIREALKQKLFIPTHK